MSESTVSVVVRVRNAARDLQRCLGTVREQALPRGRALEIVVVDNESTDRSREVARRWGAKVERIGVDEFTWGRALNRGIAAANGDIAILLSSDAYPADGRWLGHMVVPFEDSGVAAVYGRQIPRPDAPAAEVRRLAKTFAANGFFIAAGDAGAPRSVKLAVCSNACAAVRRAAWHAVPFSETLQAAEEVPWLTEVLARGWTAAYEPKALAYHSHRESVLRLAFRVWEIHETGSLAHGRQPISPLALARVLGALGKSRLSNFYPRPGVSLRARIEELFRLPFESCAFCVVAVAAMYPELRARLRDLAWQ